MLILLIACISFIFFCKSLPLKPLPNWAYEVRLLSLWFWQETFSLSRPSKMSFSKRSNLYPKKIEVDHDDVAAAGGQMCLVDLPDLVLDCILEKLQPEGLCNMAGVSKCLREMSVGDRLWDRHMKRKWGRVIGPAALREWHSHVSQYSGSNEDSVITSNENYLSLMRSLHRFWPFSAVANDCQDVNFKQMNTKGSVMSWYLALETGKFWFPAQVYNRESGHVGFMLSCYDAEVCYERLTDTFQARYPPHGRRAVAVEKEVGWDRLRAAPVDTPAHQLHVSDCLNELQPGDHIEIQWRRNKEFPYGWWYGIVGHTESCNDWTRQTRQHGHCRCHRDDTVVLEFNQYNVGSRWRTTLVSRKNHSEEGDETDGFYGGVRKLCTNDDISTWKRLWPPQVLE